MALCEYCVEAVGRELPNRDLDEEGSILFDTRPHHPTLASLAESAKDCPLCASLLRILKVSPSIAKSDEPGALVKDFTVRPYSNTTGDRLQLLQHGIVAKYFVAASGEYPQGMSYFLIKRDNLTIKYDDSFRSPWKIDTPVNLHGLTSRTIWQPHMPKDKIVHGRLDTIRSWLDECKNNHPKCKASRKQKLPTRLLDVGFDGDIGGAKLIDIESLGDSDSLVYTALSHCWGADPKSHCMTTVENEAQRRENISLDSLPKTYRDAVIVTRKLGLRYIWIDSLCIIQRNRKDWEHESSHMGAVYQGAFLTIAATSAEDGDGGLFLSAIEPPMELRYSPNTAPALVRCPAADVEFLQAAPLNSRAWTLQELVLSKRTVHFAADQLYWQCHTLLLSEDGLVQDDKFQSLRFTIIFETLDFADAAVARQYWWKWAQDYSARRLTNRGDWLAALAGITQYFADETGMTPCLGLWTEALVDDLGWSLHGDGDDAAETRRSAVPNVPSWSWLRYEAPVTQPQIAWGPGGVDRALAEVLQVNVDWTDTPLTSMVQDKTLVLSGPVKQLEFRKAVLSRSQREVWALEGQHVPEFAVFTPDERVEQNTERGTFVATCLALSTYNFHYTIDKDTFSEKKGIFLVVRAIYNANKIIYERVGVGEWDATPGRADPFEGAKLGSHTFI